MNTNQNQTGAGNTTAAQTTDIDTFLNNSRIKVLTTKSGVVIGERKSGRIHMYLGGKQNCHR